MAKIGYMAGFVQNVMERAKRDYYNNHTISKDSIKKKWDYVICDNPKDIAVFHIDIDMNILLKYIKNAIKAEKEYLKAYNINQKFTLRFIDAYKYDGRKKRETTQKENADYLTKLMKVHLKSCDGTSDDNSISGKCYRTQKGKLYNSKNSFDEVINFLKKRVSEGNKFEFVLKEYETFVEKGVEYWDESELKHLKNPTIIGAIDVDISFKPKRTSRGKGGKYKHAYHK